MEEHLHSTVREFKEFLRVHPKLVKEVRKNGRHWQEYYEKWVLLGEDDPYWSQYREGNEEAEKESMDEKEKSKQSELFSQLLNMTEKIDMDKVQKQVQQLSGTITTIQEAIGQFQQNKKSAPQNTNEPRPFHWLRD